MKITRLLSMSVVTLGLLASCSKQENIQKLKTNGDLATVLPPADPDGVNIDPGLSANILASHTWVIFEEFDGYANTSTPSLIFKSNRPTNPPLSSTVNHFQYEFQFTQNGTSATSQTGTYKVFTTGGLDHEDGTWSITKTADGVTKLTLITGNLISKKTTIFDVQVLDGVNMTLYNETLDRLVEYFSSTIPIGNISTLSKREILTDSLSGWKYLNYYQNYLTVPATLTYRENRIPPAVALPGGSGNNLGLPGSYNFHKDGTYAELNWLGTAFTAGTWTLTDNDTRLHLQSTTNPSEPEKVFVITLLDKFQEVTHRLEFYDEANPDNYSEMIGSSDLY